MALSRPISMAGQVLVGASLIIAVPGIASAQTTTEVSAHRCAIGSTERLLHIEVRDDGDSGCGVVYEKRTEGESPRAIWNARNDLSFCDEKLKITLEKLVAGGWDCVAQGGTQMPATAAADRVMPPKDGGAPEVASQPVAAAEPARPDALKAQPAMMPVPTAAAPKVEPLPPKQAPSPATSVSVAKSDASAASSTIDKPAQPASKTSDKLAMVKPKSEYDDWIFRWDDQAKEIVFTVYSTSDGRKVETIRWVHDSSSKGQSRPSNMVLAQDAYAKQVLIVAWPDDRVQHITVLDPLLQTKPICEISTRSDRDSGWGYGVKDKALYLKGLQARNDDPGDLVEFRRTCDYQR